MGTVRQALVAPHAAIYALVAGTLKDVDYSAEAVQDALMQGAR